jgi:hypothetical protein
VDSSGGGGHGCMWRGGHRMNDEEVSVVSAVAVLPLACPDTPATTPRPTTLPASLAPSPLVASLY